MSKDRMFVYLLVPERTGDRYTTRLKRAVIRRGLAGREDLVEIAKIIKEDI
jgi:hypothetical protein